MPPHFRWHLKLVQDLFQDLQAAQRGQVDRHDDGGRVATVERQPGGVEGLEEYLGAKTLAEPAEQ